ncbi:MAG: protein BatD [Phycisphaerae bacterium]|nr:protein BatD [Phycisphaerae bacterium]
MTTLRLVALIGVSMWATKAQAASVTAEVSSREVVPGEALLLHVRIVNAEDADEPKVPPMPDVTVRLLTPTPQKQTAIQVVNFKRTTQTTLTYVYQLLARRPGRFTIPPIRVNASGKTYTTEPISIVVAKGETTDLLIAEFVASRESVYVEQPFELTLQICIRPFRSGNVTLDARQMWSRVSSSSSFGPFTKQVAEGKVRVRRALRKDSEGQEREYYLYEVSQKVWPEEAGPYEPEPVSIQMEYPVALSRDIFGDMSVNRIRRLVDHATPPKLVIKPIPTEGRPPTYNNAVGRYTWKVEVDRTEVNRGQLLTLTMEIAGEGRLERVPAPPLAKVEALTRHFKVLDEQLAGEVEGGKKVFRQRIRAIDDKTTEIPPIPFVCFDPEGDGGKGKFITAMSEAIPITVHAAESVSTDEIVMPSGGGPRRTSLLTEAADSIRANYTEAEVVLASQIFAPGPGWAAALALPPFVWVVGFMVRRHSDRLRTDVAFARRRSARKMAETRLKDARQSNDAAGDVGEALLGYVADQANLPAGGLTRVDAVKRLVRDGASEEIVKELDDLLAACEAARYAGISAGGGDLVDRARQCLLGLERTWKP